MTSIFPSGTRPLSSGPARERRPVSGPLRATNSRKPSKAQGDGASCHRTRISMAPRRATVPMRVCRYVTAARPRACRRRSRQPARGPRYASISRPSGADRSRSARWRRCRRRTDMTAPPAVSVAARWSSPFQRGGPGSSPEPQVGRRGPDFWGGGGGDRGLLGAPLARQVRSDLAVGDARRNEWA